MKMTPGKALSLSLSCILACLMFAPAVTAQGMPHAVVGFVLDGEGTAVGGATVTLENGRTGEAMSTTTDTLGQYMTDLSSMSDGYQTGDTIHVTASLGSSEGAASVTVSSDAFDMCNVTLGEGIPDDGVDYLVPAVIGVVILVAAVATIAILRKPGNPGVGAETGKRRRRQK